MVLNASYVYLYKFSLHWESPDLDPERRTSHFWGGSITNDLAEMKNGLHHYFVQFFKQRLEFKSQGFKYFQIKFELNSE
jgi:hypothetical protein